MPFHLYIHLPYCRRRCPYCDFFKKVPLPGDTGRIVSALIASMAPAEKNHLWAKDYPLSVYFGGGTPSLHTPSEISAILSEVRRVWGWNQSIEVTIEANPLDLTPKNVNAWLESGINRLSIGAQSFSPRKLTQLYRDHQVSDIHNGYKIARSAGLSNISLDLIFGLPGETLEEWTQDLKALLSLKPVHVSLYNLEFHEGTPFFRWKETNRLQPLSEDLEADMYLLTHDMLTDAGYEHYEISNFAIPGFRSRHNLAYWQSKPYLGLGPSAHSFDGLSLRFYNTSDMNAYFSAVSEGRLPIEKEMRLNERERAEEWISLALRRREGISFDDACVRLGNIAAVRLWERAAALSSSLREASSEMVRLTPEGWFRENTVLLYLFPALD